jgi:hypothetical protein
MKNLKEIIPDPQAWRGNRVFFTFETPSDPAFRVYAFFGTEEAHRPYEFLSQAKPKLF